MMTSGLEEVKHPSHLMGLRHKGAPRENIINPADGKAGSGESHTNPVDLEGRVI